MVAVALVAGLLIFLWWAHRARELFLISVRDGRALVVRGHIPGSLLSDFKDALARAKVHRATLRALREDNGAQLAVRGVDEWTEQRLRNIFRVYPLSNLRSATDGERKTIWRVLGIAWLAWIFERHR
jgi:rhodanese-related sulfurtransferase